MNEILDFPKSIIYTHIMKLKYIIKENDNYRNINEVLDIEFSISSRLRLKLIKSNKIYLNGKICDTRSLVKINDSITIDLSYEENNSNIIPCKMILNIVYEDDWFLVLNKQAGIAIHPSILHYQDSISNGVKFYFDSIGLKKKIRPINRLDLNTSGLVVFSKCEYIQECLSKQMANNSFQKQYLAIINGTLDNKIGTINLPIARKENSIIERCINETGQPSITHYTVLKEFQNYSLVKCKLETGRTHQIRVHMSEIGHPILGDDLYGKNSDVITRQALHCYNLKFIHPITKEIMNFICELPNDMKNVLKEDKF